MEKRHLPSHLCARILRVPGHRTSTYLFASREKMIPWTLKTSEHPHSQSFCSKLTQNCPVAAEITRQEHSYPLSPYFCPRMGWSRRINGKHKSQSSFSCQQRSGKPLHSDVPFRNQLWVTLRRTALRNCWQKPNISRLDILLLVICPRRRFDTDIWRPGCVPVSDRAVFERYFGY
jgi:hypothetical protein